MAPASSSPAFNRDFSAQTGLPVEIAPGITRITAPNASAYTFTGTNSFLLGNNSLLLLDPGPDDAAHLAALHTAIGTRTVRAIVLTHTHRDHSASATRLATELAAPLWFGGTHRLSRPLRRYERNPLRRSGDWDLKPDRTLVDGDVIEADGIALTVHATPGHCANHLAFSTDNTLFSGDHVMGWNSTLVAVPDGSMSDYLASLDKVIALAQTTYLPAHGGPIADGPNYAASLKAHRLLRNEQVLAGLALGDNSVAQLVDRIYPSQPLPVRLAARMTINAHVEYLEAQGLVQVARNPFRSRISLR